MNEIKKTDWEKVADALMVLALDKKIGEWLAHNDPQALEQILEAGKIATNKAIDEKENGEARNRTITFVVPEADARQAEAVLLRTSAWSKHNPRTVLVDRLAKKIEELSATYTEREERETANKILRANKIKRVILKEMGNGRKIYFEYRSCATPKMHHVPADQIGKWTLTIYDSTVRNEIFPMNFINKMQTMIFDTHAQRIDVVKKLRSGFLTGWWTNPSANGLYK